MTDFDYKKYSLENLEKWMSDALSSAEATPREIYDTIYDVVCEDFYYHKHHASRCYDLMLLLNGNGNHIRDEVKAQGDVWDKEDVEAILAEREYYEGVNQDKILSCDKDDQSPECQKSWNDFWEDVDEKHSREYNLREAEYYNKRAQLDSEFNKIKASGGYEWTPSTPKDKVIKWQLPVEVDGLTGDCIVQFPDDLLEAANLKEGDKVEWVDQGNGSYLLKKV